MQGQGSSIGSFPETIDIGHGSVSNSSGMSQQTTLNNILNPVESRLSHYMSSGEMYLNARNHDAQGFVSSGEPTGSASQNQIIDDGIKVEHGRPTSYNADHGAGTVSEERQFEPNNILFPGRACTSHSDNLVRSSFSQGSSSSHIHQNMNLNARYVGNSGNGGQDMAMGIGPNLYKSSGRATDQTSCSSVSSDTVGTSSGSSGYIVGERDVGSASFGNWGLSCKRKALEGTSGQSYTGGGSSSFPQAENSAWQSCPAHNNPSSSLRLSIPSRNSPCDSPPVQQNLRTGIAIRAVASDAYPSSSVMGNTENPLSSFGREFDVGPQQESLPFNLSSVGSSRLSSFCSPHQSPRAAPFSDSLNLRSTTVITANSGASQSQSHAMHNPGLSGNMHPFPWNRASNSRVGSMSNSFLSGERGPELREEANLRNISRNSAENPVLLPANEMRNSAQDPTSWSLASGNISTSIGIPSSSRIASSSSSHPLPNPAWLPLHNSPPHDQQRIPEFAPWSLFPSIDSQPEGRSGHLNPLPPGPSSLSQDAVISSGPNNQGRQQPFLRSAFLVDRQGDDVLNMPHSLRTLAADIEGRRRLISEIRQVLNAMRRGENLRVEDYMLFDPFIYHGMAEMHDRHRDMRLDVDNMSYEELLALEERIGDVSTGLSEEIILKLMRQRKYITIRTKPEVDLEPCCVCQEEYECGDDIGRLECGHDFHTNCIKQWLMQKNLCPICKTTGLLT